MRQNQALCINNMLSFPHRGSVRNYKNSAARFLLPINIHVYRQENPDSSLLIITHSTKILESLHVDYTHVMVNGHIIATGDASLIEQINREGYEQFKEQM